MVDSVTGKVVGGPEIHARGFAERRLGLRRRLRTLIEAALDQARAEGIGDVRQLQQMVRRTVGKWVSDTYRRRPMIIPLVVEV